MKFIETNIPGALLLEPERLIDERGFFARTWCLREFAEHGLDLTFAQCSISFNAQSGTLRGLHYQVAPYEETKLVRCTRGAVYDVLLDLRPASATYTKWQAFELSCENHYQLYIPPGVAHGFMTLSDNCEVSYQISIEYHAASAHGVRWDDPAFAIAWPAKPQIISDRDRRHPLWTTDVCPLGERRSA